MKIILARHGETSFNRERLVQDNDTPELSELGKKQAMVLAEYLAHEDIDVIFCSPAKRTKQTLEIIKKIIDVPATIEPLLVERDAGDWIGKPVDDMIAYRESKGLDKFDFKPEGGESFFDVRKRAERFWDKIEKRHDETVLIVGHSLFHSQLLGFLLGKEVKEFETGIQPNASVHEIIIEEGRARATKVNYDKYLTNLKSPKTDF